MRGTEPFGSGWGDGPRLPAEPAGFEALPQERAGAVEARPEVRGGDPQELLDLLRAQAVQLAEEEGVGEPRGSLERQRPKTSQNSRVSIVAARVAGPRRRADPPVAPAVERRLAGRVGRDAVAGRRLPARPCGSDRRSCAARSRSARSARSTAPRTSPRRGGPPGTSPGRRPPPGRATGAAAAHSGRGRRRAGPPSPRGRPPASSLIGRRPVVRSPGCNLMIVSRSDTGIPDSNLAAQEDLRIMTGIPDPMHDSKLLTF